jgi:hypothetical protein
MHLSNGKVNLVYTIGVKEDQRAPEDINAITVSIASDDADAIPAKPFMKFGLPVLVEMHSIQMSGSKHCH